jgi:acetyl-CoA synthetase
MAGERSLQERLGELLTVERFEPEEFRETAQVTGEWIYDEASTDELGFWAQQARELHWDTPFTTVLDDSDPPFYKWFTDGRLNVSYNCLDRHVEAGRGEKVAYHWVGEEGETRDITYAQLLAEVQRFANGLKALGVGKGDVVGIFLPMVPEVVVAMLACARIGAVHNVVFGGFSAASVRERMEVSTAKALVTADEARRKGRTAAVKASVDAAMGDLESLRHIVVVRVTGAQVPMMEGRDVFYDDVIKSADPVCVAEPMEAENPLFIMYSSGSTAKPKGILHTTGGYLTGVSCSTSTLNGTSISAPPTSGGSPDTATSCTGRWPTPRRA